MTRARDLADSADKDISGTLVLDDITLSNDISIADNGKAIFGAGSDLQIFHDGATGNSFITEGGSGNLVIAADDFRLTNSTQTANMIKADEGGAVTLTHNGGNKLATTSTGIDVTGTAVTDGLTVAGNVSVDGGTIKLDGNYPVGTNNVALGDAAGAAITSGGRNTLIGGSAGDALTAGQRNVVIGTDALSADTQGSRSVAIGQAALANQNFTSATDNYNVAVGFQAGVNVSTGITNTMIGGFALQANTTGSNNTAVGYQAGYSNTSWNNSFFGYKAGYANTTGTSLVAIGEGALDANTTASFNIGIGANSLGANTTGASNTAIGDNTLRSNTTASNNTAVGYQSLYSNTTANKNTAVGWASLKANTTGENNTAIGHEALDANTTGNNNTALGGGQTGSSGYGPLSVNTTGSNNVAIGNSALIFNTTASQNTAVGYQAGYSNTTGIMNTFIGEQTGRSTTSSDNTFVGRTAGYYVSSGAKNTILGRYNGNQGGLDIRTSSNNIVLSDGDGNVRAHCDSSGTWTGVGSSTTYGDVGTYIFGYIANTGVTQGSTYSGSSINPCGEAVTTTSPGTDSDFGSNITVDAASSNSGTWRAMGRSNYNSGLTRGRATLFVRIS